MKQQFDVIVVGAGHAGVEAAHAAATMGGSCLLLTMNLDSLSFMACNPSIGGSAKSHLVHEIDALGGLMGILADKSAIQIRMLNTTKGAAVRSLRTQADRIKYHLTAKKIIEQNKNITIKQGEATQIQPYNDQLMIRLLTGEEFCAPSVVIACGVYLQSNILIGDKNLQSGPSGFNRSSHLSSSLQQLGLELRRFSTSTPPRIDGKTVDYSQTTIQHGDDNIQTFSSLTNGSIKNKVVCHMVYTNKHTHDIIAKNITKSPMYRGNGLGSGPRYCPSIEDKIATFPDRDRHQLFLEPESLSTNDIYVQGLFTGLPGDVQQEFVNSIDGLQHAQIVYDGYAIEYDCIDSTQLFPTLEFKGQKGLFFAGQINGSSGYEEAAAQGLVAGISALLHARHSDKTLDLSRTNSYIGVLIDDLVTKGTAEPYRMLTSRAEHRLHLRQDNADIRLTQIGRDIGLVCDKRWRVFQKKLKQIEQVKELLSQSILHDGEKITIEQYIKRGNDIKDLELFKGITPSVLEHVETETKYEGYLARQNRIIHESKRQEQTKLPSDIDYSQIKALSREAVEKLTLIRPLTIAQATRISGITPADISVLLVWLKKNY
ncbi:MAG: tRNA uridine-5-carboxymethylaminomethyl(34) synthesis enzyme MnmG [Firmicutes bacterium]|nr:tRNA uridine-5-carboxymethylaminomethyl(34) synthesis enzyme MnmG [Bacillota bacterium]